MATGGGEMSRSLVGSSDVIHDFPCTPCDEDGKNTEAVHYCVNCDTFFCQTCVVHHNKLFKSHKLLDKDDMSTATKHTKKTKRGATLPSKECENHPGNIVQMFCGTHDVCCCTVCIALEHRQMRYQWYSNNLQLSTSKMQLKCQLRKFLYVHKYIFAFKICQNVDFIPKFAKGILQGKERHIAKSSLEKIRGELLKLKSEKEDDLTIVKQTKQYILEEMQQMKKRLIARVNELERKSREEVCERYDEISEKVNTDIDTLNDLLQSTEAHVKNIEELQSNESEIFVAVKYGRTFELSCKPVKQQIKQNNVKTLSFVAIKDIEALLDSIDSLGVVTITDMHAHTYYANLVGEYNVKVPEDNQTCKVSDLCVLDDDNYIITDFANSKIKRLDKTFNVTDWCTMHKPWGVCKTGTNEVAVTLFDNNEVTFISTGRKLLGKRSFKVGFYCRGITYNDDKLFIGGAHASTLFSLLKGTSPDEIKIYNLAWSLLHTCRTDNSGNDIFGCISHLTFSLQDSYIYIADREKGLITLDTQENKLSVATDKTLKKPFGVSSGEGGQLFVCDYCTGSVFQQNKHNDVLQEILTQSDGIQKPISVTFVQKLKQLVVTCEDTNTIKVFQLI